MELISVIVPVYNVEHYLDRCVESIVNQTYKNLEIILVDDGSPDNCPAMCDAWAEKDSRIKVIHKKNGGLSDARNAGMMEATGQLMGFIDSDDWIEPDMYELLYDRLRKDGSDIAACGVEMCWEDGTAPRALTKTGSCVLNRQAAMDAIIRESWLKQPVWYKLYKTELIQNISFPVGKYHEDVFWSYQAVAKANLVSVFDSPCYHYTQRSGSIMGGHYSIKRLDAVEAKQQRLAFLQNFIPDLVCLGEIDLLFTCIYHGQMAVRCLDAESQKKALHYLNTVLREHSKLSQQDLRGIPFLHKVWLWLARINLSMTCKVRNVLCIGI